MSKFKVGDKVLLEGEIAGLFGECQYPYSVKLKDDGVLNCRETQLSDVSKTYEDGLNDGWKVLAHIQSGELSSKEIMDIWGMTDLTFVNCFAQKYKPQEAIKILEAYEKSQQIQVGDVVRRISDDKEYLIITRENDNSAYNYGVISLTSMIIDRISYNRSDFERTGRHIDISSLLEQIRGNE